MKTFLFICLFCSFTGLNTFAEDAKENVIKLETIQVKDLKFTVRTSGPKDGELVILLHGFPQTSYSYKKQLVALAKAGYRVVAPDQRGYSPGARPKEIKDYNIKYLAQDVIDIADQLKAKKFHLVGHDWGAAVAWTVAAKFPERVTTLTALSIPHPSAFGEVLGDPKGEQAKKSSYIAFFIQKDSEDALLLFENAGLIKIYDKFPQADIDEYVKALGSKEALGAALNWYRAAFGRDAKPNPIPAVTVKTLYIWGAKDSAVSTAAAERNEKYVDKETYTYKTLPDSGHWILESDSEKINTWLLEHMKK
jgi:pimeloyl-ACP methyl ester carboxylesterase